MNQKFKPSPLQNSMQICVSLAKSTIPFANITKKMFHRMWKENDLKKKKHWRKLSCHSLVCDHIPKLGKKRLFQFQYIWKKNGFFLEKNKQQYNFLCIIFCAMQEMCPFFYRDVLYKKTTEISKEKVKFSLYKKIT